MYDEAVATRYHIYNSLFLKLPFEHVYHTGTLVPLLHQACVRGFQEGMDPTAIIEDFFAKYVPGAGPGKHHDLLFNFIQYIERQIVLFDAIEDAAFDDINDTGGNGTVKALLLRTRSAGLAARLKQKLEDFSVRIVLTAHPTQFYPGHVLAIINDLEKNIRRNRFNEINRLLHQLGKTAIINREKPTPYEEAASLCWYLENIFYPVIPGILLELAGSLDIPVDQWRPHGLLKLGFWPGGDRDGNPFVTSETSLQVAAHLRQSILKCYHRDLSRLKRRLTFAGVDTLIAGAEQKIYAMAYEQEVAATYAGAADLLEDLGAARAVLVEQHDGLFLELLDRMILTVRVFGFYLASMDIRQDSRKHAAAWDSILAQGGARERKVKHSEGRDAAKRIRCLLDFRQKIDPAKLDDKLAAEIVRSIACIGEIQDRNGPEGCHRYVISNTESALDVVQVFALARLVLDGGKTLPLDIVPLFESIDALTAAPGIMHTLYELPEFRTHLASRGHRQTIMLGFSDGTKDGGYLRANWSIYQAKENLTEVSRKHGIEVVFFDGRGGPPGRGGGNTHDFYASLGDKIEGKEVQITIQGQTVSSNFGNRVACRYNIEQLLCAGIENEVFHKRDHVKDREVAILDELAEHSHRSYLALKNHPQFVSYLETMTPLSFFPETNIGSRPMKRGTARRMKFADLRAIPFVGAWAQMKQNIPGFYGIGSALHELKLAGRLRDMQCMYRESLLFRTLLSNSMMALTKSYFPATAYIGKDSEFTGFWNMLYQEYELSRAMILEVSGLPELMASNPVNRDSVKMREKIVLPLITIQQFAMQQLRNPAKKSARQQKTCRKLVLRCMFGIINAARNSA